MPTDLLETDSTVAAETIAAAPGLVVVDFTAAWCQPCRMLTPVLDQLAREEPDVVVLQVDVDASPELASAHAVMSFPTVIFFAAGRPVRRVVGARGIGALREELRRARLGAEES